MNIKQAQQLTFMSTLDRMLAKTMAEIIKEKTDEKTRQNLEIRLQARYGTNIIEAIEDFHKFDATLREFFGPKADALEKDFLAQLISLDTSKKGITWIIIKNQDLSKLILESYGDRDKRLILDMALKTPGPILDILESCKIPKSSGYRIINELTEDGLLIEEGYTTSEGKNVVTYTALFENVTIDIEKSGIVVKVLVKENIFRESFLVKILLEL